MTDTNVVVMSGRVTRDTDLKYTKSGTAISSVSLAVNRKYKDTEEVSFIEFEVWGKTAESITKYLTKGQQVIITGELKQDRWEQDGQKRSKISVTARMIQLIGSKGNTQKITEKGDTPAGPESFQSDDIPF